MISDTKIIEIFCNLDDFMKEFDAVLTKNSISDTSLPKKRNRKSKMSKSEVMTIMVIFHLKSHRNLKHFYLYYVSKHMDDYFPDLVSYNRFVELQKSQLPFLSSALIILIKYSLLKQFTQQFIIKSYLQLIRYDSLLIIFLRYLIQESGHDCEDLYILLQLWYLYCC